MSIPSFAEIRQLLTKTWEQWNSDGAPRLGAALSYYTMLSLAPLLIILIAIAGLVFGADAAQGELFFQIRQLVGEQGAAAIQDMVKNASKPGSGILASIIGVLTLVVGASTVAAELQNALNVIWLRDKNQDVSVLENIRRRSLALGVVLGCGFLLLVSLAVSSTLAAVGKWFSGYLPVPAAALEAINFVVAVLVITGVFGVMFRYLPALDIRWRDVLPGAVFTAVLFSAGKLLIGLYLGKASIGSTYGAAGSLVVVLVWVYYSAQIFFFGAEFAQVYAVRRSGKEVG